MEIQDIMKLLAKKGVSTSIHYNSINNKFYLDLETRAKSELHLYEDGVLRGRYDYETQIDMLQDDEVLVRDLCYEFNTALHDRNYYQAGWAELCRSKNISIETY